MTQKKEWEAIPVALCPAENAGKHWTCSQRRSNTKQWTIHHILTEKIYVKSDYQVAKRKKKE